MRTRKQRAGKFIGQGVYGCGFTPSLRCKGEATRRNGLSKMMIDKGAVDEEYEISARIARLDPERKYFITASGVCEHDQSNINRSVKNTNSRKHETCNKFPLHNKSYLLFYEMGGSNLETNKIPVNKYPEFLRGLENLFAGLVVLHEGNIVHADIKPDNIVGKLTEDGNYKIRYIDFGVSIPHTERLTNISDLVVRTSKHTFQNYPPHYPIDSIMFTRGMNVTPNYLNNWYASRNQNYPYDPRTILYREIYPQLSYWDAKWRMPGNHENIIQLLNRNRGFYDTNTKKAMESLDIYSLGMALSILYSRITGHYSRIDNDGQHKIAIKQNNKEFILDTLTEASLGFYSLEWHKQLAEGFSIPFYKLIMNMLELSGTKRPSAINALYKYQELIVNVDYLFTGTSDYTNIFRALNVVGASVDKQTLSSVQSAQPIYQAPQPIYQAPQPIYQAPQPIYQAPQPIYQAPQPVKSDKTFINPRNEVIDYLRNMRNKLQEPPRAVNKYLTKMETKTQGVTNKYLNKVGNEKQSATNKYLNKVGTEKQGATNKYLKPQTKISANAPRNNSIYDYKEINYGPHIGVQLFRRKKTLRQALRPQITNWEVYSKKSGKWNVDR